MTAPYKILIPGKPEAGKKQLINRLLDRRVDHDIYTQTLIPDFKILKLTIEGNPVKCSLWPMPESTHLNPLKTRNYYPDSTIVLYCIDLDKVEQDIKTIQTRLTAIKNANNSDCTIVLVGIQTDLTYSAENRLKSIAGQLSGYDDCLVASPDISAFKTIIADRLHPKLPEKSDDLGFMDTNSPPSTPVPHDAPPGFLKKHMKVILGYAGTGAAMGAVIGAGIGIGMSVTASIPTFGVALLGSYWAIAIMSSIFGAIGAGIGLVVGLVIANYREHEASMQAVFATHYDYLHEGPDLSFGTLIPSPSP